MGVVKNLGARLIFSAPLPISFVSTAPIKLLESWTCSDITRALEPEPELGAGARLSQRS